MLVSFQIFQRGKETQWLHGTIIGVDLVFFEAFLEVSHICYQVPFADDLGIEQPLVFTVATLNFSVMRGMVRADTFQSDTKMSCRLFKFVMAIRDRVSHIFHKSPPVIC